MIELRTLGIVELRGSQGQELRSILQQPKRLALLAYLTLARPHGFRRRDSIIALFWPDLDQRHGRAALRQALHVLRAALGSEVIIGRGEDDITVEPAALWCDAVAFDQALDAGDPEKAMVLYRGDLLEGFFAGGGSAELEHWLDEERSRLRRRAAEAACSAASHAARQGGFALAIAWAQRATTLEPASEDELRRLVVLLDQMGDRSAALALYQTFARRLALDLEAEPASETRQLMDRIRARGHAEAIPAPNLASEGPPGRPDVVSREAASGSQLARAVTPTWPWVPGLTAVILALSIGIALLRQADKPPPRAPPAVAAGLNAVETHVGLAILPLANESTESGLAYLAEELTDAVRHRLSHLTSAVVLTPTLRKHEATSDRDLASTGRAIGAARVLDWALARRDSMLTIRVVVIRTEDGRRLWSTELPLRLGELWKVEDELALGIVAQLPGRPGRP